MSSFFSSKGSSTSLPSVTGSVSTEFLRDFGEEVDASPDIKAWFFYTFPNAVDDVWAPVPTLPSFSSSVNSKVPPRPFSFEDNQALEAEWQKYRSETQTSEALRQVETEKSVGSKLSSSQLSPENLSPSSVEENASADIDTSNCAEDDDSVAATRACSRKTRSRSGPSTFMLQPEPNPARTTGTPFIRAPSPAACWTEYESSSGPTTGAPQAAFTPQTPPSRPGVDPGNSPKSRGRNRSKLRKEKYTKTVEIPIGVSRLHQVVIPELQMKPIYWIPLNHNAPVVRATWFYKNSLFPVEPDVANRLELGYIKMRPWTQTWQDELHSAVEVGAIGETKIIYPLWPGFKTESFHVRTRRSSDLTPSTGDSDLGADPDLQRRNAVIEACHDIDEANKGSRRDHKATGSSPYGSDGAPRTYLDGGVIYLNATTAYILRPNLQPSTHYNRRPLANYIRQGHKVGVCVVRGFDPVEWDSLHSAHRGSGTSVLGISSFAGRGTDLAESGISNQSSSGSKEASTQQIPRSLSSAASSTCGSLNENRSPLYTDLVLVIHGIGQKLSERIESFHFTHSINRFRRQVNIEQVIHEVKVLLRKDMGGIMVLPINWRMNLSFEDGGFRDEGDAKEQSTHSNSFSLKDITPDTLPSVRNVVSDVLLDVPYYLSNEHRPKMIAACIAEANRIYRLWCSNNKGFERYGRVHIVAHSLGSVMAVDILSNQPTRVGEECSEGDRSTSDPAGESLKQAHDPESRTEVKDDEHKNHVTDHFLFNTSSFFVCGSPCGFFLLLKRAHLVPRAAAKSNNQSDPCDPPNSSEASGSVGSLLKAFEPHKQRNSRMEGRIGSERGQYGCLAVENIYNIINPYDPVSYRLNPAIDVGYAQSIKQAWIPHVATSYLDSLMNRGGGWNGTNANHPAVTKTHSDGNDAMGGGFEGSDNSDSRGQREEESERRPRQGSGTWPRAGTAAGLRPGSGVGFGEGNLGRGPEQSLEFGSEPEGIPGARFGRDLTGAESRSILSRLPSNVELETHNFPREKHAETMAFMLNDNGQVDYYLRYGGGALEIQYLTMLGAHSSYWTNRDFIRMLVIELGRPVGPAGCVSVMRAVKKQRHYGPSGSRGAGTGIGLSLSWGGEAKKLQEEPEKSNPKNKKNKK